MQTRFADVSASGGDYFRTPHLGRGVAFGDLDNDGNIDLVISHLNEPVTLLRNNAQPETRWLGVALRAKGARDLVGARLIVDQEGRVPQFQAVKGGGSYLSSSDRRYLFGLETTAQAGKVTVAWSSGLTQHWDNLVPDRYWRLVEGKQTAESVVLSP
jgi:hypothetical protein